MNVNALTFSEMAIKIENPTHHLEPSMGLIMYYVLRNAIYRSFNETFTQSLAIQRLGPLIVDQSSAINNKYENVFLKEK